ncbi:MAG: DUF2489 domain-containing protein [Halobacteriovoraceae bacterium]|nr:DUF2489 domain-containing protein [Halobacteriovoraceae bacterium]
MEVLIPFKNYFFVAFGILIPILGYAIFLQWKALSNLKDNQKKLEEKILENERERQTSLEESIRIISMATIQGQCEISEACLRLANLIPSCRSVNHEEDQYKQLFSMYEEIKNLKTHEARNELKTSKRFEEDKFRFACEEKYHDDIKRICDNLYELFKKQESNGGRNDIQ